MMRWIVVGLSLAASTARADEPAPDPPPIDPRPELLRDLAIHGFVSQGAFVSTANDYLGHSSRGSLELFEAGLNLQTSVADDIRVGMQLFTRDVGKLGNYEIGLDWAYLDWQWRPELGVRAGHIRLPFGLYNEYADIDSARVAILMPQALYPIGSRDVLLAHTGFAVYGNLPFGETTNLDYQLYGGTLFIDPTTSTQVTSNEVDSKYVVGAQAFYHPPIEGLKVGASFMRTSIDYKLTLAPALVEQYVADGTVPADFDGKVVVALRPATLAIGSLELLRGDWTFAAEYSRWYFTSVVEPRALAPRTKSVSERAYALAAHRFSEHLELGAYYSLLHADAHDRQGRDPAKFPVRAQGFQRDAAATLRIDVTDRWLWKLEAHFIDGVADLARADNPDPTRYWAMFLARTTVTF